MPALIKDENLSTREVFKIFNQINDQWGLHGIRVKSKIAIGKIVKWHHFICKIRIQLSKIIADARKLFFKLNDETGKIQAEALF